MTEIILLVLAAGLIATNMFSIYFMYKLKVLEKSKDLFELKTSEKKVIQREEPAEIEVPTLR